MKIRRIELKTADGLSPLPMSSAWVRDGLFLIGMDSEFAVYSQWRGREETAIRLEMRKLIYFDEKVTFTKAIFRN